MGSTKRIYFTNAVYHVIARGNNKQKILEKEEDKRIFLKSMAKYKDRFKFKLYAFVLMDNHIHLIISSGADNNISKIMQAILLSFSSKYRWKYGYVGHVWQGRFKSKIISGDLYILECINYIHNNPVRAQMVDKVEDYQWSSVYLYNEFGNALISEKILLDRYGDTVDSNY